MCPLFFIQRNGSMYRDVLFQSVTGLVETLLRAQGFELVELQLQQRPGRWLVRVFVDREDGIALEDCRRLSLEIGHVFDMEAIIPASYVLEVSSPGLDRPLRTARDFRRQSQRLVTVFLHVPLMGQTQYTGRVAEVDDTHLVLHMPPDTPCDIPLTQIDHGIVELEFK
ncbi:Ribosome maturation factor RimP [Candidatus Entotheonellaceae bacterium PAL068K]